MDVIEVVFEPFLYRAVSAPTVHLRPPRDARFEEVSSIILLDAVDELLHEVRALRARPDDTHIPSQNINELGQFVEARASEKPSNCGTTKVVFSRPLRISLESRLHGHRTELEDSKGVAV